MTKIQNSVSQAVKYLPVWQNLILRGGRLTKIAGQAVSMSPSLGRIMGTASVSAISFGAAAALSGSAAFAGSCTTSMNIATCTGASTLMDTTQYITDAEATTVAGFGLVPSAGHGISLTGNVFYSGNISFTDANASTITGAFSGIRARHNGSGALSVISTGAVTGLNGMDFIATAVRPQRA